jgi:ABC-type phosphate/phosphonate transport system permease subunit
MTPHETSVRRTIRSLPLRGAAVGMVVAIYGMATISTVAALSLAVPFGLLLATFTHSLYVLHRLTIDSDRRTYDLLRELDTDGQGARHCE